MHRVRSASLLLALALALEVPAPADARDCSPRPGKSPAESRWWAAQCRAWNFRSAAEVVHRNEPYLYPNPAFRDFQRFTLRYQRYIGANRNAFARQLFGSPRSLHRATFEKVYRGFVLDAATLWAALPDHVALHRSMFTHAEQDRRWSGKLDLAYRTMVQVDAPAVPPYRWHDCDYLSQPLNALYFALNAALHLDRYAAAGWGAEWGARRAAIHSEVAGATPAELVAELAKGFSYRVGEYLADAREPGTGPLAQDLHLATPP